MLTLVKSMPPSAALFCSYIKGAVSIFSFCYWCFCHIFFGKLSHSKSSHSVFHTPQVSVTAYVSERCSAANLNLHVCLFTGEEDTVRCPPPRHATRAETAHALRGLAHAGNGRFLWTTETGEERVLNDCLNDGVFQGRQVWGTKKKFSLRWTPLETVLRSCVKCLNNCCLLYSKCCCCFSLCHMCSTWCLNHNGKSCVCVCVCICVCAVENMSLFLVFPCRHRGEWWHQCPNWRNGDGR